MTPEKSADRSAPGSVQFNVQFLHPSVFLGIPDQPLRAEAAIARHYFGVSADAVTELRNQFASSNLTRVRELLTDSSFMSAASNLPFKADQVVAAVGDSMTDDLQSWAYQLDVLNKSHLDGRFLGPELWEVWRHVR